MSLKFLIVDDSRMMQKMITNHLKQYDITDFDYAKNGNEAIDKYKKNSYDFVTLDIVMPGINGIETLKEIKKINNNAKVIMISSMGQRHLIQEANEARAFDFIVKPFNSNDIESIVKKIKNK